MLTVKCDRCNYMHEVTGEEKVFLTCPNNHTQYYVPMKFIVPVQK